MQKFGQFIFILGNNPELSKAEIMAVLPKAKMVATSDQFLVLENEDFEANQILEQLGGTIKIGKVIVRAGI